MATQQAHDSGTVREARERFVPRGVASTDFVVARAEGATLWDSDGNELLDFAGGIACQTLGHNPAAVVRAVHEQVDQYLHQCFMVGMYEPYVEVARRLDALWPGESETKTLLVNSGAEAIEHAVKTARAAPGRAGGIVFDRAFHGRTNLTMAMTSKLVYKKGFGPFRPDIHPAPAPHPYRGLPPSAPRARAVPVPRRHPLGRDRRSGAALRAGRRSGGGRLHRARDRPGRGRLHPD